MKYLLYSIFFSLYTISSGYSQINEEKTKEDFVIAFGSCNKQSLPQPFWSEILKNKPDLFIWGGDNIYGDSEDMSKIKNDYRLQNSNLDYQLLKNNVPIMATWDDHDYGKNDVGAEWKMKRESQQLFLDFLEVEKEDERRNQEGIYTSKTFKTSHGSVKVIVLDTRYFRSPLLKDPTGKKRYIPHDGNKGTVLGEKQWKWLEEELKTTKVDFHVIVSSIQFLSGEHGWECWANFPNEVTRLEQLIVALKVKNCVLLSGDRHISEFSKKELSDLGYPIVDFTSSGLTHSYLGFNGEPNQFRVGDVIHTPSFGILKFNFETKVITMQMRGKNNKVLQEIQQQYLLD
ncbi:alkaline phosphatase D family protein [Aquimarina sp. 433]